MYWEFVQTMSSFLKKTLKELSLMPLYLRFHSTGVQLDTEWLIDVYHREMEEMAVAHKK